MSQPELRAALEAAVQGTFPTLIGREAALSEVTEGEEIPSFHGYSGIVGFGSDWSGALVIQCPKPLALSLTNLMLGDGQPVDDDTVKDAVGEIVNVVAGSMKLRLSSCGVTSSLSLPTIVEGNPHQVSSIGRGGWCIAKFSLPEGEFLAAARIKEKE